MATFSYTTYLWGQPLSVEQLLAWSGGAQRSINATSFRLEFRDGGQLAYPGDYDLIFTGNFTLVGNWPTSGTITSISGRTTNGNEVSRLDNLSIDIAPFVLSPPGSGLSSPDVSIIMQGMDTITGLDQGDTLRGYGGADEINGAEGNDSLTGNAGSDTVRGGDGIDTLFGDNGDDFIYGGLGGDIITGGADNDYMEGNRGADILYGEGGNDTMYGGPDNDTLWGGNGADLYYGEDGDDLLYIQTPGGLYYANGGDGFDTLFLEGGTTGSFDPFRIFIESVEVLDYSGGTGETVEFFAMDSVIGANAGQINSIDGSNAKNILRIELPNTSTMFSLVGVSFTRWDAAIDEIHITGRLFNLNSSLIGSAYKDFITGGSETDLLDGLQGIDVLIGGAGSDVFRFDPNPSSTLYAGSVAGETIDGGEGEDDTILVKGNAGTIDFSSSVISGIEELGFTGSNMTAVFNGLQIGNAIGFPINRLGTNGASLNNTLKVTGSYADLGNLQFRVGPGSDLVKIIITGTSGMDLLFGSTQSDLIDTSLLAGDDRQEGFAGNDTLLGGTGHDTLNGGDGNDLIDGGDGNDTMKGWIDNDTLLGGGGRDTLDGQDGNDSLYGWLGNDLIFGGIGDDRLDGEQDNDTLWAFDGNDSLFGGIGDDSLFGEAGADSLAGQDGVDQLFGWLGNDTLIGGDGNDIIFGEQDNDLGFGGLGTDVLWGGDGNDTLFGEQDNDTLLGEIGDDVLLGIDGDDVMYGWVGNDTLYGWTGNDVLWGEEGNDSLLGEGGADTFIGGLGRDTMTGGAGADRFFNANFEIAAGEVDLITDFDAADRYLFQTGAQIQYFNFNAPGYGVGAGIHVQLAGGVFILDVFGANASQLQAQTLFF